MLRKNRIIAFYCSEPVDCLILANLIPFLPHAVVIAKNHRTKSYLKSRGIQYCSMPYFPDVVIMCRHAAHKFPSKGIVKFGFRHGVYHFKKFTKAVNYNAFDLYFVTSDDEEKHARALGINNVKAIGFPKLDAYGNGKYAIEYLNGLKKTCDINPAKITLIFTATWEKSGMSAIRKWYNRLDQLTDKYNILVTVHPWTSNKIIKSIQNTPGVYFIDEPDVMPYMLLSDVLIGDTSSIIITVGEI